MNNTWLGSLFTIAGIFCITAIAQEEVAQEKPEIITEILDDSGEILCAEVRWPNGDTAVLTWQEYESVFGDLDPTTGTGTSDVAEASSGTQILHTAIQDPEHPDEPWDVTTYRKPSEGEIAFIRRHRNMIDAVRVSMQEQ